MDLDELSWAINDVEEEREEALIQVMCLTKTLREMKRRRSEREDEIIAEIGELERRLDLARELKNPSLFLSLEERISELEEELKTA